VLVLIPPVLNLMSEFFVLVSIWLDQNTHVPVAILPVLNLMSECIVLVSIWLDQKTWFWSHCSLCRI